jgi:hypothetical protein
LTSQLNTDQLTRIKLPNDDDVSYAQMVVQTALKEQNELCRDGDRKTLGLHTMTGKADPMKSEMQESFAACNRRRA